ncbi:hypothetical protein GCM10025783_27670 [Amnibacterium soli]|uniref:Acyltransferase 3 domain-containing protein n=1 Tax=Amnibacterium soli TaxID=1282736 RepID=A0ABP8ZD73_9MICO
MTVYPHDDPVGAAAAAFSWLRYGNFGVAVFIVLSGYSLMIRPARQGGLGESYWSFIRRRFRRIVLPYWIALAVSLVLALTLLGTRTGTHWDAALPVTWPAFFAHLLVLQDVWYSASINHVFWSVALEWHIYFVFPVLLRVWSRVGRVGLTLGLLVLTTGISGVAGREGVHVPVLQYLDFLGLFAVGALSRTVDARFAMRASAGRTSSMAAFGLLLAAGILLIVLQNTTLAVVAVGLATAAALVAMENDRLVLLRRLLGSRPLVWLGTISFSLYLIHALVVQAVWQYALSPTGFRLEQPAGLALLLPSAGVLSVLAAWGFWFIGERPFLSRTHGQRVEAERSGLGGSDPVHSAPHD